MAIQESFKAVEKYIQIKSNSSLNGTKLMERVFSPDDPLMYWTSRKKISEKDELSETLIEMVDSLSNIVNVIVRS